MAKGAIEVELVRDLMSEAFSSIKTVALHFGGSITLHEENVTT